MSKSELRRIAAMKGLEAPEFVHTHPSFEEIARRRGELLREARELLSEIPLNIPNTLGLRAADCGGRIDAELKGGMK